MTRIRYSKDVDVLLVELSEQPIEHAEESGQFIIHFSADGVPVLLEILNARDFLLGSFGSVLKGTETVIQ